MKALPPSKEARPKFFPMPTGSSGNLGWHYISPFTICPKEYQYSRVRGIRKRGPAMSEPLSVGLLLHAARAQWLYDKRKGKLWVEAVKQYASDFEKKEGKRLSHGSTNIALSNFSAFVDYWRARPVTEPLAIEYLITPRGLAPNAPEWAKRTCRIDSIERWQGKTWIGEFKSTSSSPSRVADIYMLNGQTLLQAALWGPEETKEFGPLAGILLDVIVKQTANKKARGCPRIAMPLEQMKHALSWFPRDFAHWVMQSSSIQWNDTVERRPVCQRPHGACDFKELCLRGRDGALKFELEDGTPLLQWSPSDGKSVRPWE